MNKRVALYTRVSTSDGRQKLLGGGLSIAKTARAAMVRQGTVHHIKTAMAVPTQAVSKAA